MAVTARPAGCVPVTVKPLCNGLEVTCLAGLRSVPGLHGLVGQAWQAALERQEGHALTLCFKMRRCALLLALCGLALLAQARAMTMAPAPGPMVANGMPLSADLLLPESDNDVVALLSHLMSAQHEVVLATHGKVPQHNGLPAALSGQG